MLACNCEAFDYDCAYLLERNLNEFQRISGEYKGKRNTQKKFFFNLEN